MDWNEATVAALKARLSEPLTESGDLPEQTAAWLREAGDAAVPFLIDLLGDETRAKQAQRALQLYPRRAVSALVAELNGEYCTRFRRESRGEHDRSCQSACSLLGKPLMAIAAQAEAANDQDVLLLLGERTEEVHRAYHQHGCGCARYAAEVLIPCFGRAALHYVRKIGRYPWDKLEDIYEHGASAIPALFDSFQSVVGSFFPNFVANAVSRCGDEAVPFLAPALNCTKVGASSAAALSLIGIGSKASLSALFAFIDGTPDAKTFDARMTIGTMDRACRAVFDDVLSEALAGEPKPARILAVAETVRCVARDCPKTIAELRRVRPLCGDVTYVEFRETKPITAAVDQAIDWSERR